MDLSLVGRHTNELSNPPPGTRSSHPRTALKYVAGAGAHPYSPSTSTGKARGVSSCFRRHSGHESLYPCVDTLESFVALSQPIIEG
jgi:hypothetical protein